MGNRATKNAPRRTQEESRSERFWQGIIRRFQASKKTAGDVKKFWKRSNRKIRPSNEEHVASPSKAAVAKNVKKQEKYDGNNDFKEAKLEKTNLIEKKECPNNSQLAAIKNVEETKNEECPSSKDIIEKVAEAEPENLVGENNANQAIDQSTITTEGSLDNLAKNLASQAIFRAASSIQSSIPENIDVEENNAVLPINDVADTEYTTDLLPTTHQQIPQENTNAKKEEAKQSENGDLKGSLSNEMEEVKQGLFNNCAEEVEISNEKVEAEDDTVEREISLNELAKAFASSAILNAASYIESNMNAEVIFEDDDLKEEVIKTSQFPVTDEGDEISSSLIEIEETTGDIMNTLLSQVSELVGEQESDEDESMEVIDTSVAVVKAEQQDDRLIDYLIIESSNNYLSEVLTANLWIKFNGVQTLNGVTLNHLIQAGIDHPQHPYLKTVGVFAGDEDSYTVFEDFLEPLIQSRHPRYSPLRGHVQDEGLENLLSMRDMSLDENYVLSVRVRGARNVRGFCLPSFCTRAERKAVEKVLINCFNSLADQYAGQYLALDKLDEQNIDSLISEGVLFARPTPAMVAAKISRDWPMNRGLFANNGENIYMWVNEEDHLRIISHQEGGDLKEAFNQYRQVMANIESAMKSAGYAFMFHERYGYIASCPSNVGTGMRASAHVRLPTLSRCRDKMMHITDRYHLELRGAGGADTPVTDAVYDVSNHQRLGVKDIELVDELYAGITALIALEKEEAESDVIGNTSQDKMSRPEGTISNDQQQSTDDDHDQTSHDDEATT